MALNFPNSPSVNQIYTADQKSWRWTGSVWNVISSGFDLSTSPSFTTVAVAGQNNVTADTATDTLTLAAGPGIVITTNSPTDTITFTSIATTGNITIVNETIDTVNSNPVSIVPNLLLGGSIRFPDNTIQTTATVQGPEGPPGPVGSGAGDVSSVGGGYTDNALVRYNGTSGASIQTSLASIDNAGTLSAPAFSGVGSGLTALNASNLSSGTVPDARFPATLPAISGVNLTALNASNIGSGTVPDARFPTTLPTISGVNLTALNASNLGSGTVPVTRLGTAGTRDATTFLRGDNTWAVAAAGGGSSDSFAIIAVAGQSNVVADSPTDTLTLAAGTGISITTNAGTDTVTVTNTSPNVDQNVFTTVAVSGQSNVVADSTTDTLTLVAGSNITITTNAATDAITINATAVEGTISDSFVTIAVAGQNSVVADSSTDTLTLASGTGISITTDAATDTITITNTAASGGATTFTGLSDSADLTVDKFYLPAITMLRVTNNSSSSYRFDQYGATNNPTVFAINGTTIAFNLTVSGHPFLIQTSSGVNFNEGLVHVTPAGVVSNGSAAQGKTTGTLYWKVPVSISGNYRYICSIHSGMVGIISIKDFAVI